MSSEVTTGSDGFERASVFAKLAEILATWGAGDVQTLTEFFAQRLADAKDGELEALVERVDNTGQDWGYHPPDPLARTVSRLAIGPMIEAESSLGGAESLEVARQRPVILLGNHLSFVDGNVLDLLMAKAGYEDVASRLAVVVGPKVFSLPIRRLASLCFGTIKIPQSTTRASGEAVMSIRDVARLARRTLGVVQERQQLGEHLLVFPEGTRSREHAMQRSLAAVARYLEHDGAWIVPFGLWGTEKLVPLDEDRVFRAAVHARLGAPIEASMLFERAGGRRSVVVDALGFLVADLLPESYRGAYATETAELAAARDVASNLNDEADAPPPRKIRHT